MTGAGGGSRTIETRLGHRFADPALLTRGADPQQRHRRGRARRSNERLEFLGDRVLGLVIADLLIGRFPQEGEGALSRRHAALVRREALAEVAGELGARATGWWSDVARRMPAGAPTRRLLANVMEALIGAVYRDGGLGAAAGRSSGGTG